VMQTPFCLCKHILHTMLEVRDEKNTSLSFGCLITKICLPVVTDISDSEPRSRIPDPLGIQTLMKSNAQLRHEALGGVPQPPPVPPPVAASSSQAMPPTFDIEAEFTQLMSSMGARVKLILLESVLNNVRLTSGSACSTITPSLMMRTDFCCCLIVCNQF